MNHWKRYSFHPAAIVLAFLGIAGKAPASTISFTYALPAAANTSAGVYATGATPKLVKTLWSGVSQAAGTNTASWDGIKDDGTPAPPGDYTIKVLANNVKYTWEGVIGNSSSAFTTTDNHIWRCYDGLHDMAFSATGATAIAAVGYNEMQYGTFSFNTSDPQTPSGFTPSDYTTTWEFAAIDGTRVYLATPDVTDDNHHGDITFVEACNMNGSQAGFTNGTNITSAAKKVYIKALDGSTVKGGGPRNKATGIAVQQSGNVLAVAHGPLNQVRLFDKTSGSPLGAISVAGPGRIAFAANGDLWVITGSSVQRFTGVGSANTPATTIGGFSAPLAVAVDPANGNVLVCDGGASQQVKAYTSAGSALWTLGQPGGYQTNGPAVTPDKFWFVSSLRPRFTLPRTFVAVQPDGTFWVNDGGNNRTLHFSQSTTATPPAYIPGGEITLVPDNQYVVVDPQNPKRIFGFNWLEYSFNYGNLQPGDGGGGTWALVNNWAAGVSNLESYGGLSWVRDLANGSTTSTYAFLYQNKQSQGNGKWAIAILPASGPLKFVAKDNDNIPARWVADNGDMRYGQMTGRGAVMTQTIYNEHLTGFDASGVPQWAAATVLAGPVPANNLVNPVNKFASASFVTTASNLVLVFDATTGRTDRGYHFGAIPIGGAAWQWQTSPVKHMVKVWDGKGSYPDQTSYGGLDGNNASSVGDYSFWNYNGQYGTDSKSVGMSNQYVQYSNDGLYIGQFGTTLARGDHAIVAAYGYSGNYFNGDLVQGPDGNIYAFNGDESAHMGIHVWKISNLSSVKEFTGTCALGQTEPLLLVSGAQAASHP